MLERLSEAEQARVIGAMASIESLLAPSNARPEPILLRPHRAGDMGWVTSAHGAIYAQEYGWDITFEALVAKITAEFIENFDAKRECCWIAEMDGERVGSAFVVRKTDDGGEAASAYRRSQGARFGARQAPCRRMPALCERRGLQIHDAVDAGLSLRGARHLRARRDSSWWHPSRTTSSASISSAKPGNAIFEPLRARRARRRRDRRAGRRRDRGDALCGGRHLARLARLPALCHWRCLPCARRRDGQRACALRAPTSCRSRRSASASSAS